MNNNKQTAVDYLDEAIDKYLAYCVEGSHKGEPFTLKNLYTAVQQAKEIEKEQIVEAYRLGHIFHDSNDSNSAQEYYDKEYGKETDNN